MDEDIVTVIMPAYNAEKYIQMSIESVMLQTYPNVELVIVDDASTDSTPDIMRKCANIWHDRIRLFHREHNGGTAAALNDAIELASGRYICWLSADDLYCKDMVVSEINYLQQNPQYDAVFSRCALMNAAGQVYSTLSYDETEEFLEIGMPGVIILLLRQNFWHGCSLLAKAKCFKREDKFNVNFKAAQDYDFWLRMAADYDIGYLDKVNVLSRVHDEQGSKKMNCLADEIRVFFNTLRHEEVIMKLYKKMGIEYSYQNIKPFIENRVTRYTGRVEELNVLSTELKKYMDMIANGKIHFQN